MAVFHTRNEWGGREPNAGKIGQVSKVIIHHTASQGAPNSFDPQRWRNLENGEIARGYSSLAYHFGIVNGAGEIVESRGWGNKGAATGGNNPNGGSWNDTSVAIVIDGYFHPDVNDQVSESAIEAAADCIVNGVYLGFISRDFTCIPHSEASQGTKWATACPGDSLRNRISGFLSIEAVAKYKINQSVPIAIVQPQPGPPAKPRCVGVCEKRILRMGSTGTCTTTLQRLLAARGFNPGPIDGHFGKTTLKAVQCAQSSNGLPVDGVVGPQTWAAIA